MTHWPFIAASYALGVLVPAGFGLAAFLRMGAARRRLSAIDPRIKGPGTGPRVKSPGTGPRVEGPETGPQAGHAAPDQARGASA